MSKAAPPSAAAAVSEPPACTAVKRLLYADDAAAATAGELEAAAAALRVGNCAAAAALLRNALTAALLLSPEDWPVELADGMMEAHGPLTRGFLLSKFDAAAAAALADGKDAAAADAAGEDAAAAETGGLRIPAATLRAALLRQWWHLNAVLSGRARVVLDALLDRMREENPVAVLDLALCDLLRSIEPGHESLTLPAA